MVINGDDQLTRHRVFLHKISVQTTDVLHLKPLHTLSYPRRVIVHQGHHPIFIACTRPQKIKRSIAHIARTKENNRDGIAFIIPEERMIKRTIDYPHKTKKKSSHKCV